MAVDFYMVNSREDICMETKYLNFEEKIQRYLIKTRERTGTKSKTLLKLDPHYTERSLDNKEILDIIEIGKLIKEEYKDENEVKEFADKLISFFSLSIETNIGIYAAGD